MAETNQALTIHLPTEDIRRLIRVAEISRRPLDDVIAVALRANLPPLLDDLPSSFQDDLARLESLPNDELRLQMNAQAQPDWVERYDDLLAVSDARTLTEVEVQELTTLRREGDLLMYRKAYAALLLKWRGEHVPSLADLEKPRL